MYKLTCAYDSNAPHWSAEYENEFGAWENFFRFTDWGSVAIKKNTHARSNIKIN